MLVPQAGKNLKWKGGARGWKGWGREERGFVCPYRVSGERSYTYNYKISIASSCSIISGS